MDPVVHFEMPYEDKERVAKFYASAFGWKAQMMGEDMGEYVVMQTAEMDEGKMAPKEPGRINGGMFKKTKPDQYPSVVIAVKDITAAMGAITAAGGTILGGSQGPDKPDDIPGVGLYCSFRDTEGNRVGVLQPKE